MKTEQMLRSVSRHKIEATLQMMGFVVNYRNRQKQLNKVVLHLKTALAKPPIHDQAYPEKLSIDSPVNLLGVTQPNLLLLFLQQDKKSLGETTTLCETYFLTKFGDKYTIKAPSDLKVRQNQLLNTLFKLFFNASFWLTLNATSVL